MVSVTIDGCLLPYPADFNKANIPSTRCRLLMDIQINAEQICAPVPHADFDDGASVKGPWTMEVRRGDGCLVKANLHRKINSCLSLLSSMVLGVGA